MFERIKALLHRWQDLAEVDRLTDREIDDLGVTRDQLRALVSLPGDVPQRVKAMASLFGLAETDLTSDHGTWLDLLESCGQCRDRGACALVLEREGLSRPQDADFCPNAAAFRDLAQVLPA